MASTSSPGSSFSPHPAGVQDKITAYEIFLNEQLKTDLKNVLNRRDLLYAQIAEYSEQETILKKIPKSSSKSDSFRVKVDLGCNFYAQSEVTTDTILFDIGCGIWLPVTIDHGLTFCRAHINRLNKRVDILTSQELRIKAQINIVLEALKYMQGFGNATNDNDGTIGKDW